MGKFALIFVSTLIFGMITYSHSLQNSLLSSQMQTTEAYNLTQAQNIAQSTAMVVVNRIRENDPLYTPPLDQEYRFPSDENFSGWAELQGEYRVQIQNQGDSLLVVKSTGRLDQTDYLVTVTMDHSKPIWEPNIPHAVFAGTSIEMNGSSTILGDVATNAVTAGSVYFKGNPQIKGDLTVGPGGDPYNVLEAPGWKGTKGWVEGELTSTNQPFEFALPPFPDFPPHSNPSGSISLSGFSPTTLDGSQLEQVYIPEISIKGDNTLTINTQGKDLKMHIGNLNIQQGHLEFTGGGNVTLLVEENMTLNGSSTINATGDPENLLTYYKGSEEIDFSGRTSFNSDLFAESADIVLAGSGGVQGDVITGGDQVTVRGAADAVSRVIYAPQSDVALTGSGSVRGSIVANSFSAEGASNVVFEGESGELPDIKLEDGETRILSWH